MKIFTQNDFFVAICARSLRDRTDEGVPIDDRTLGFLEFFRHQRTEEELRRLVDVAEQVVEDEIELPTPEKLKKLSSIFSELPEDEWKLFEMQYNAH